MLLADYTVKVTLLLLTCDSAYFLGQDCEGAKSPPQGPA